MIDTEIDVEALRPVPAEQVLALGGNYPSAAWVDRKQGLCVMVWNDSTPACNGTPWHGTLMVGVKYTNAKGMDRLKCGSRKFNKFLNWDDLQAIKDRFWPNQIALEVYPPKRFIVNAADMRWLWVLPKGAMLPFDLRGQSLVLKS